MMKAAILKYSVRLHRALMWLSLFALFALVLSAITHPLMAWFGPQSKVFMPPKMTLQAEQVQNLTAIIKSSGIQSAIVTKVVPTATSPMLQITDTEAGPRRYFSLETGEEVQGQDEAQAEWLARYYTGLAEKSGAGNVAVKKVTFVTEFSNAYPWVNRLLPVYKIEFDTPDNLSAFIYTETNSLGSLNDRNKYILQTVFRALHTWSWLDDLPLLRVVLLVILCGTLVIMLLSGIAFLIYTGRKRHAKKSRIFHRQIAWFASIPLLFLLVSGIYHLFQSEYGDNYRGMRLGQPISLTSLPQRATIDTSSLAGKSLNSFSLIQHNDKFYYRAGLAKAGAWGEASHKPHAHHGKQDEAGAKLGVKAGAKPEEKDSNIAQKGKSDNEIRNKRFDGVVKEKSAIYLPLAAHNKEEITDEIVSTQLAVNFLKKNSVSPFGEEQKNRSRLEKVKRFGPEYDFRNKRLPVWKYIADGGSAGRVFIDPTTGILVDYLVNSQRIESYSFSFLHKWNFLRAFLSREARDVVVVGFLLLFLALAGFGYAMRSKPRKTR